MKILFTNEQGRNPFKNAIMAAALDAKKSVTMSKVFTAVKVEEWREFMNLAWHACAECTKDHRGQWCVERTPVTVHMEDGRVFSTFIWYDVATKGLRYVSLY